MGLAVGPVLTGVLADRWGLTTALASMASAGLAAGCRVLVGVAVLRPGPDAVERRSGPSPMPTTSVPRLSRECDPACGRSTMSPALRSTSPGRSG